MQKFISFEKRIDDFIQLGYFDATKISSIELAEQRFLFFVHIICESKRWTKPFEYNEQNRKEILDRVLNFIEQTKEKIEMIENKIKEENNDR